MKNSAPNSCNDLVVLKDPLSCFFVFEEVKAKINLFCSRFINSPAYDIKRPTHFTLSQQNWVCLQTPSVPLRPIVTTGRQHLPESLTVSELEVDHLHVESM